jgi:hypothetical protein
MSESLLDLQRRFAASILDAGGDAHASVYRNSVIANYRNALGATFGVVRELTGTPFFNATVDAFVAAHPSTGGDLNVYGGELPDFLAAYPYARELPYLPDVARLEWALDEANRAEDASADPEGVLAALAQVPADAIARQRFALDASCRFVRSAFPVMRIWQVHQGDGDRSVDLGAGPDHLLVRREGDVPSIARLAPADLAFLAALDSGDDLGTALEAALEIDGDFDLASGLRTYIADGTIARLA